MNAFQIELYKSGFAANTEMVEYNRRSPWITVTPKFVCRHMTIEKSKMAYANYLNQTLANFIRDERVVRFDSKTNEGNVHIGTKTDALIAQVYGDQVKQYRFNQRLIIATDSGFKAMLVAANTEYGKLCTNYLNVIEHVFHTISRYILKIELAKCKFEIEAKTKLIMARDEQIETLNDKAETLTEELEEAQFDLQIAETKLNNYPTECHSQSEMNYIRSIVQVLSIDESDQSKHFVLAYLGQLEDDCPFFRYAVSSNPVRMFRTIKNQYADAMLIYDYKVRIETEPRTSFKKWLKEKDLDIEVDEDRGTYYFQTVPECSIATVITKLNNLCLTTVTNDTAALLASRAEGGIDACRRIRRSRRGN